MTETITANKVLDCSGLLCPMPIIRTSQAIKELEPGQILKIIATDAGFHPDIEAWSRQTGHVLLATAQEDGKYIAYVRKSG